MSDPGIRLSDLLVSLSLLTDLGFGQPTEHMLRSARIGMRLGERLGLEPEQMATLYDVGLLTYVGCPTFGHESSRLFGDDIVFRSEAEQQDLAGFPAMVFMLRRVGQGGSAWGRAVQVAGFLGTGGRAVVEQMAAHCSAAGALAGRLGLGEDVRAGIEQAYARWDGRGVPDTLSGDALSLAARISHVAEACEVFERNGGTEAALEMVRARSGTHFDPEVAQAAVTSPAELFAGIGESTLEAVMDAEPTQRPLSDDELDAALEAIGDFCDLRCSFFAGHARGTAALVESAAELLRMPSAEARLTYRAALIHDVGRFGVDASVWTDPGPLTPGRRERMRMHVYYVERIFDRPEPLRRIGLLAATHHERMDGSGYHRGLGAATLSAQARLLAAAHSYHAMLQPRPYRGAANEAEARLRLQTAATDGRLDPLSVDAVLAAGGHHTVRTPEGPAGLTPRECEVVGLLATGLPNKAIARRLGISPKTVGNHVERAYAKLGVTNRAAATMAAMQHGLVP